MINTQAALENALTGTPLANRKVHTLPVLDTGDEAYVLECTPAEAEALWKVARSLLPVTQRWPILSTCWNGGGASLKDKLAQEDLFSRFYFEEQPDIEDASPQALIEMAATADLKGFLQRRISERGEEEQDGFEETVEYELGDTQRRCGKAPSADEVSAATLNGNPITTRYHLDKWLLDWEQANGGSGDPEEARQEWYEPGSVLIVFLPTANSWEVLAYMSWYGSAYYGTENYIALVKHWHEKFGAELVAHYGTMLQFLVARPPATLEAAWPLALQHDIASACTLALPGIALRHHAVGLVNHDRWFLHERP